MRTNKKLGFLITLCIILLATPSVFAYYPTDTPVEVIDSEGLVELTVDVSPKYVTIPPADMEWTVSVRAEILKEGVSRIEFWVLIEAALEDASSLAISDVDATPVVIYDSSGVYVETDFEQQEFVPDYGDSTGWWFWYGVETEGSWEIGEFFTFDFDVQYPYSESGLDYQVDRDLCWVSLGINTLFHDPPHISHPGEKVKLYYNVGPAFVVPELPLGTFGAVATSILAIIFLSRRTPSRA